MKNIFESKEVTAAIPGENSATIHEGRDCAIKNLLTAEATLVNDSELLLSEKGKKNEALLLEKEIADLSFAVSHDLKAPLRIISGYAGIIQADYSGALDTEGNRLLALIVENASVMSTMLDAIVGLSRVTQQEYVMQMADMNSLFNKISEEHKNSTTTETTMRISNLASVICDVNAIRTVAGNLLSNAIKFSANATQPTIEIGSETGNEEVVYFVRDNGTGFDMKYSSKLFRLFQRLHSKSEYPGIGAGLAVAAKIIHKHGGKIWAESVENKGTTFYFSLPINNQ
jgi:light-regulated signal transduction histidine kinase (bacteriophytochrome)